MLFLCAWLPAAALQIDPPALPPALRLDSGASLQLCEHGLWAFGPRYKAELGQTGIRFVPALGERAPHNLPLELSLLAFERGGAALATPVIGAQHLRQARAERSVAAGITEVLEATEAGLELAYRFDQRPGGDGDLVVRLALDSELPLSGGDSRGLEFLAPGIGGVRIGGVTGIDRRGLRSEGALRLIERDGRRELELSLPDAFVDAAEFPLLLDPLIGAALPMDTLISFPEADPDAVWSVSGERWVATWTTKFSASDWDVRARAVAANGSALGDPISLESGELSKSIRPQIASFDAVSRMLVIWSESAAAGGSVKCRAFAPDFSGLTGIVTAFSSVKPMLDADVAGRRSGGSSGMIVLTTQWSLTEEYCWSVQTTVPASGNPTFGGGVILNIGDLALPRLARFPDQQGRFFAAWRTGGVWGSQNAGVHLARLSSGGGLLAPFSFIPMPGMPRGLDVDQSPDGQRYLASVSTAEGTITAPLQRLQAYVLSYNEAPAPGAGNFAIHAELETQVTAESSNAPLPVGGLLCGQSVFLARNVGNGAIPAQFKAEFLRGVRETGATISKLSFPIDQPTSAPAIASRSDGASTQGDELLLLYSAGGGLFAQPAEVYGQGQVAALGGGCGSGGSVQVAGSAVVGHPGLSIGHSGAPAGTAVAVLNVTFQAVPLACGACLWNPFQVTAIQPVAGTSIAPLVLAIPLQPALIGKQIELQWTLVGTPDSPCALSAGIAVSNRLGLTIGE